MTDENLTVQPTRDRLRAHLRRLIATWEGPGNPSVPVADLAHLLDQLDAAERRADEAEARFQAVEDVLAAWHVEPGESGLADDLLRALNT